jgi:uncharacterized spore protein YtfJ
MDANKLYETTVAELERLLSSKSVVGEPIKVDGTTIVPLISLGVGFGIGGNEGVAPGNKGPAPGMGAAGGGGVKPVAVLIADAHGVRVESIKLASSVIGKIAESVAEIARPKLAEAEAKKLGA